MIYTFSDGTQIEYEIIRKNNKNIYFRFKDDLKLYISAPMYVSQRKIEELIKENEASIFKMYQSREDKVNDDKKFKILGKKYYIVIDEEATEVSFQDKNVVAPSYQALDSYLNKEMLRVFNEEVELAKKCFSHLPEFTLRTRKMTTRWGVNDTRKKIITLNTELIKHNINEIDYVIIHELCHFFEPNHSKDFWALVKQACPNYKEIRKSLRN